VNCVWLRDLYLPLQENFMSLLSRLERTRHKNSELSGSTDAAKSAPAVRDDSDVARNDVVGEDDGDNGLFAPLSIPRDAESSPLPVPLSETETPGEAVDVQDADVRDVAAHSAFAETRLPSEPPASVGEAPRSDAPAVSGSEQEREYFSVKHAIFDDVFSALDPRLLQQPQRDALASALEKAIRDITGTRSLSLSASEAKWLQREFENEILGFGPITDFLNDNGISKISINGSKDVGIERLGQPESTSVSFRDNDHLSSLIRRIADIVGGRIDPKVPLLDRPLPDGSRVRAKVPPLSVQPSLIVEKKAGNPFDALRRQQAERATPTAQPYNQLRERIQLRLVRELESELLTVGNPDKLRGQVEELIGNVMKEERVAMSRAERASLAMDLLNEIVGLGPLEPLLNDPEIDEIMVNGPFQIYTERRGRLELAPTRFRDNTHILQVVDRMVAPLGRRVDEKSPMVDGRLRDGSRFNVILPPLALSGPTITIRKFARDPYTMTDLVNFGTISREAAQFMQACVEGRLNCVVSGGTGSGKTTTLNVLSSFIPATERIVTIEDAAELQMRQDHVIRLETRPPNIEGAGMISIRDLVRNSLRMRPDRIIVGECRGAEALDMLQAMNTGHDGSLTTLHANSPRDMLKRLETMVLMAGFDLPVRAVREQISMAVQMVLHQERMRDGVRRVTAITEIFSMEGDSITMQDIFTFKQEGMDSNGRIIGKLAATGLRPKYLDRMAEHGVSLPIELFAPATYREGQGDYQDYAAKK
jgi:pilus assembly protein CpaF